MKSLKVWVSNLDIKQLEYFICVSELGSFTRASITLGVAQPALSRQIRQLEVELGQSLLIRNGRGVYCTEGGTMLLEHARGILHQVDRARSDLEHLRGTRHESIAVGLPPTLARFLTLPLVTTFNSSMNGATISVSEGLSNQIQELLIKGRLDIAVLYHNQPSPDIDAVQFHEEELFLIERVNPSAKEVVTLAELATIPLVMPSRQHAFRQLLEEAMGAHKLSPHYAVDIDGVSTILELVRHGLGNAILPKNAIVNFAQSNDVQLRRIGEKGLFARLSLATSTRRPHTMLQKSTIELIKELIISS
ncbi:LysR family transcriptional regulator [Pantoea trifolii]|uniref:LysR substrate-binding domain-containing protein n=1 Tax=Pantoea trifolii TaxID=2968030 RepID=A0ABT1VS59_9GAMM|nr:MULTISPECIES: LysR substrate-binding domain-containing protein [unclassified Pantoea]MCQ8230390.1 LysR substrate-binding domain-containing protein [Pantoea sp. MMK2]MCQ8239133.1 LysR substrate-binding domain-containing protein [Pantoea sp. MMK3]